MNKIKILHCADLHFDTPFRELNKEVSDNSREELLEVFKKIIDLSIEKNVQVLLISGDVFDNLSVNKRTLFFITDQLRRIKNIYVFIAPGNHDPYNEKSFYNIIQWPENVYIFNGKMINREIKELNLVIWGAGFSTKYEREPLIKIENIDNSNINLMILHGDVTNNGSKSDYNPIYLDDIVKSKVDYIALGHTHKFSGILKEGKTYYAYSGCPQGRGFDEEGEKGVILGDVYKGGVDLRFIPINKREYIVKEVDISACNNYEDVKNAVINIFDNNYRKNNLFKIILTGELQNHFNLNIKTLEIKLKEDFYFIKMIDKTTVGIDLEELSKDYSVKGQFVKLMLERLKDAESEEKEIINRALKLGIQCLSEEEVNLNGN